MKNNAIRQAIEHHVDGLRLSEEAVHAILQKAREGCPVKRKTSLMLVAVIVLLLGAATALAVTALHGLGFVGREMDGSVYSGTTDGQRLYYSDGFSLMVWQPENETPQVLISGKSWREAGLSTPGTRPGSTSRRSPLQRCGSSWPDRWLSRAKPVSRPTPRHPRAASSPAAEPHACRT